MEKIGLIAGNRKFPFIFCEAAKKRGYYVVAVAIKGDTSPGLRQLADRFYWLDLSDFSRMFKIFKDEGVTKVIMAGQISPRRLFSKEVTKDKELKELLSSVENKKADTIFGAIAARLSSEGLQLLDSTTFIEERLPQKGVLTAKGLAFSQWEDVYFGFDLAKEIAFLDIGQTVAVKNKAIVAVEALEGTDNLIRRAGQITGGGFAVVKVSKPKQDMRFDIPVVGLNTVRNIARAGGKCLAIEAGKTLFIDKEESIEFADRKGIAIAAI